MNELLCFHIYQQVVTPNHTKQCICTYFVIQYSNTSDTSKNVKDLLGCARSLLSLSIMTRLAFCALLIISFISKGESLYCYRCNSNHPGCGTPLNWLWYWGETCPEYDDKCVKIIERKGAETVITRDCLSSVRSFRTDIPADRYEGCRPAAKDVRLGHYVNNTIQQLDIHRDYYDQVTWCFCYFDHRCNNATGITASALLLALSIAIHQLT